MKKFFLIISLILILTHLSFSNTFNFIAPSHVKEYGKKIFEEGKYYESVNYYLRHLNSYPEDELLLLYLGYSYQNLGQYHKAEKTFIEILELNPSNRFAKKGLFSLYYYQMMQSIFKKNINLAFDFIKKAEYYIPEYNVFFIKDAELNMKLNNYYEAAQMWWEAWEKDPSIINTKLTASVWKLYQMGICYRRLDRSFVKEWKKKIFPLLKEFPENKDILKLSADIYFYNNEEPVKRNEYRNKAMQIYLDSAGERPKISLNFPVKGAWIITSGPFEKLLDTHNGFNGYNIDLVKINKKGNRLKKGNGTLNDDYYSYDRNVYSVLSGTVDLVFDRVNDNKVGDLNYCTTNLVQIEHIINGKRYYSQYVHLKKDSVKINKGDKISSGQFIGKVGNSGLSYAPHLHFGFFDEKKVSLPIYFKNISLDLSEEIRFEKNELLSPMKNMVIIN